MHGAGKEETDRCRLIVGPQRRQEEKQIVEKELNIVRMNTKP